MVVVDLRLRRRPGGAGFGIVGVAHARRGVFGEDRLPHRRRLRSQVGPPLRHRIPTLPRFRQRTFPGAFGIVGFGPVLIEQEQLQLRGIAGGLRAGTTRDPHHVSLELLSGRSVDEPGQLVHDLADHLHMFGRDAPLRLRGGGRRQHRGQRLSGHRLPRRQQRRLTQPAVRLRTADPVADRQHVFPILRPHLHRRRLHPQPGQRPMLRRGQPAARGFQLVEQLHHLRSSGPIQAAGQHSIDRGA